jgi:hypothetical protein
MEEAEKSILGAILSQGALVEGLEVGDLFHARHQALLRLLQERALEGVDLVSVLGMIRLLPSDRQAELGGIAYVAGLPSACPSIEAVPFWLRQLREARKNRELHQHIKAASAALDSGDYGEAQRLIRQKAPSAVGDRPDHAVFPEGGKPESPILEAFKALKKRPDRVKADEVLRRDSRWEGRIWWDDFAKKRMLGREPYQDADDTRISLWLSRVYRLDVAPSMVGALVGAISQDQKKDPLESYLSGLAWDGTERIATWLQWGLGVADTPIHREIGRMWLIQAVARALKPGSRAEATLVLLGEQGEGKTSTLRDLVGSAFWSESKIDIGNSPRCYQQIAAAWVHELGEMAAFLGSRIDQNEAKNFLTAPVDDFIPLHGRNPVQWPRRCVFVGTANRPEILRDPTGARRFWPVEVGVSGPIQRDRVVGCRDQLWAEAVHQFRQGAPWWLPRDQWGALKVLQEDFNVGDAWQEAILDWLSDPQVKLLQEPITSKRILVGALGKKLETCTRQDEMRIGDIMARLGWRHKAVWSRALRKTVNGYRPLDPSQWGIEERGKEEEET